MKLILFVCLFLVFNDAFSQNVFLKINAPFFSNLDESTYYSGGGYIALNNFFYGLTRDEATLGTSTSPNRSSNSYPEFMSISLALNRSYISLFKEMLKSTRGTGLEVHFVKKISNSSPNLVPYQILKFDDFYIQSIEPDDILTMNVVISYKKIHTKNFVHDAGGRIINTFTFGWDFATGREWAAN